MNIFVGLYDKEKLYKLSKFQYYVDALSDLQNKGIKTFYVYPENNKIKLDNKIIKKLNKLNINLINYDSLEGLLHKLKKIGPMNAILINTFEEQKIQTISKIKEMLNQLVTQNYQILNNKKMQREILLKHIPETTTKYISINNVLNYEKIINLINTEKLIFPVIVKPAKGVASKGVTLIQNKKELKIKFEKIKNTEKKVSNKEIQNKQILIEEYIDGEMYTIDYRVDENQNIIISKPVKIELGTEYGINDFSNILRVIDNTTEKMSIDNKLYQFIKKTVKSMGIKNTFIHHEYKINTKQQYKTIEINGRIGGYRVEMYQLAYKTNILYFPFQKNTFKNRKLHSNIAVFAIYPSKESLFNGYNQQKISEIKKLDSFYRINEGKTPIGAKIGLAKNGFSKIGSIVMVNQNNKQFKKDISYIKNNYFSILKN